MKMTSTCEKDTFQLGFSLAKDAKPGDIYCLEGDLGAGKTVFANDFVLPSFDLVFDDPGELYEIGYDEYFYGGGVCLIEWPSKVAELIPAGAYHVSISRDPEKGPEYREITVNRD